MATISVGDLASLDPVLTQATESPSPAEEKVIEATNAVGIKTRVAEAAAAGPTTRQRTQSEILDLELVRWRGKDPFSVRHIPFDQMREMTTDLMLGFGWFFTVAPLCRADWLIESPDAQLAAAVDVDFRPIATATYLNFSNSLWFGHQPLTKRFKLGKLGGYYRDPQAADPSKDIPIWTSSADALLWKSPMALNPSHCIPMWDDDGDMIGFKFSNLPIPNFDLLSAANAYGYMVIPGHVIDDDYAMWVTNEQELNFGSIYGSPRTKRAYRYWWSYWYRWALADRAFENHVDPAKIVYYPTDFDEFIDSEDNPTSQVTLAREKAIRLGESTRSGATIALPADFIEGPDGKPTSARKWEITPYASGQQHFSDLDQTFAHLDTLKLRSWLIPEQAFIEGRGATSSRLIATQLGEVYQESQQLLLDGWDAYVSEHMFPQCIAAHFPDKIGTPCRRVSSGLGAIDEQLRQTVLTLVGQVRGEVMPVDIRTLLMQSGIPILNEWQMRQEVKNISELQAISQPPEGPPTANGTQGYNAGVERTLAGETRYVQGRQRILLAESDGFMNELPDTPHYRGPAVRSSIVRLRRLFVERYSEQYASFAKFLEAQPTLHLADSTQPQGVSQGNAKTAAAAIITAWAAANAPGVVGSPIEAIGIAGSTAGKMADLVGKIGVAGGVSALKGARLDTDDFGAGVLTPWVQQRVGSSLSSIDDTVRSEAQSWLEDQLQQSVDPSAVAAAAKDHFAGFAETHADRVARTEVRDAYNRGTLEALHLAGVEQVQAHDASDGSDELTDAECLARDGKIMGVQDAMSVDEHPNGTLWFSPLSTDHLRVERVDELPLHLEQNGAQVAYDSREEILYLLTDVDAEHERMYLLMLGDQISYR